jgi:hypothetical protein
MTMPSSTRKRAIREYKERQPARGAFAVRCLATNRVWVGASTNLDAARNGTWFLLRYGQHRDRGLQAEWNAHGESAFRYDVLETVDADASPFGIGDLLKEKKRHWAGRLGAQTLLP